MDGFFTKPFLHSFPENLLKNVFLSENSFYEFFQAINKGRFVAGTDTDSLLEVLERLKCSDKQGNNELYQVMISMHASGKLRGIESSNLISEAIEKLPMRKTVLRQVGRAISMDTSTVLHDDIGNKVWKEKLLEAGKKPIFENQDLSNGSIQYLFNEMSMPVNIGENFNWSRFLSKYVLPFKMVRILDPYLYVNIRDVKLASLLKTLSRKSGQELKVEIISDLTASSNSNKEDVFEIVKSELSEISDIVDVSLYSQKGSASKVFHKRVIWTDFWSIHTDRGLDFVKLATGQGKAKQENTLFMTGKYASKESLWYQIHNNWSDYLDKSTKVI